MRGDFFPELKDFLSREWILIADVCAIFAGWVPIDDYTPTHSYNDYSPRMYLRLADGKRITPGQAGFKEIIRIQKNWTDSDWQHTRRNTGMPDIDPMNEEIRVREAFKIGIAMNIERVAILYDNAVEAGLFPIEHGTPIDESLAGYITLPEKSPEKSSRVKKAKSLRTGYFGELEKWLELNPSKPTAKPFVQYLKDNEQAKENANVIEIHKDCAWIKYEDQNNNEKVASLDNIRKVIRRRKLKQTSKQTSNL